VTNGNVVKAFDKFAPLAMEEDLESHEVESIPVTSINSFVVVIEIIFVDV
jgi:hypothetical protein